MKVFGGLFLAFLAVVSYFLVATRFALYQRWPVAHFLILLLALGWLLYLARDTFSWPRAAAVVAVAGLTGLFAWYTLDYSAYENQSAAVEVGDDLGERLEGVRLASAAGDQTPVLRDGVQGTLLVFYRGYWWPFCRQELVKLQEQLDELERRGIRIVAISIDPPEELEKMRQSAGAEFEFLSDPDGRLLDLFGVRHAGGRFDGVDIAQSASFLLDDEHRVAWLKVAENYRVRPKPEEILDAADQMLGS